MSDPPKSEHALLRVMVFATSLSFGILAAIIVSMKDFFGGNAAFEFSYKTAVGFVLGCAAGWVLWQLFLRWLRKSRQGPPM